MPVGKSSWTKASLMSLLQSSSRSPAPSLGRVSPKNLWKLTRSSLSFWRTLESNQCWSRLATTTQSTSTYLKLKRPPTLTRLGFKIWTTIAERALRHVWKAYTASLNNNITLNTTVASKWGSSWKVSACPWKNLFPSGRVSSQRRKTLMGKSSRKIMRTTSGTVTALKESVMITDLGTVLRLSTWPSQVLLSTTAVRSRFTTKKPWPRCWLVTVYPEKR